MRQIIVILKSVQSTRLAPKYSLRMNLKQEEAANLFLLLTRNVSLSLPRSSNKEIQGCTLKNYFECKLISPEEIEEEEPSIGKKKKYKLSVRENLRKFRSNISSSPRAFTKQTSRKECQP